MPEPAVINLSLSLSLSGVFLSTNNRTDEQMNKGITNRRVKQLVQFNPSYSS
ncbi:MAG TPA: hypothetical protein PLL66_02130 [Bacteroidales bacterium]|nr:hypothetical protein [Bacteroidales bacterium]